MTTDSEILIALRSANDGGVFRLGAFQQARHQRAAIWARIEELHAAFEGSIEISELGKTLAFIRPEAARK